ncbi:MAG: phosphate ABC transporter permease PstA [Planctomycetes bacterium]|nr:phosphate ABC transporter permease PstA [Planctomycetota bacterium]
MNDEPHPPRIRYAPRSLARRRRIDRLFVGVCVATSAASIAVLVALLAAIVAQGYAQLNWRFIRSAPSPSIEEAGVWPALMGTIWVGAICAALALPTGVGTAILLEEYRPRRRWLRRLLGFIQLNIGNLAGVPSVVYGILGLTAFVNLFGLFGSPASPSWEIGARHFDQYLTEGDRVVLVPVAARDAPDAALVPGAVAFTPQGRRVDLNVIGPRDRLPRDEDLLERTVRSDSDGGRISREAWYHFRVPLGRGVLAGALTLALVTLPIVIIASQEALRAVPSSLREGALGLGATRWQVVWNVTLPAAVPGIMTGSILAISRAVGEAAPILIIAGIVYISTAPRHLVDDFSVLPLQIYNWAQRPQPGFHALAASGIVVLLVILLSFNAVAIFIRARAQNSR